MGVPVLPDGRSSRGDTCVVLKTAFWCYGWRVTLVLEDLDLPVPGSENNIAEFLAFFKNYVPVTFFKLTLTLTHTLKLTLFLPTYSNSYFKSYSYSLSFSYTYSRT